MKYLLMNKNESLVEFETEYSLGSVNVKNEIFLSSHLPIGFKNISTWIENRNYAKHKGHFKEWLKAWKIDTTDGFLQITHCLGLNDTFWVKMFDSDLKWEDVNLYHNKFTDVACKTAFEGGLYGLQLSTTSPEFTSDGSFPKCWIKDDKGIHILKQGLSGASNTGLEPYSEYISSNICCSIFDNVVKYNLVSYKNKICSVCDLFTNENVGYIPFSSCIDTSQYFTISKLLDFFINYDAAHHTNFENKYRAMILMDSLVFNIDRHLGNFGFLFDTESFEILDFAPVFDFNFSFLTTLTDDDLKSYKESFSKYDIGHKLGGSFENVGREIMTYELKAMLPAHLDIPQHQHYNMSDVRTNLLKDIFNENYNKIRLGSSYSVFVNKPHKLR